MKKRCISLLLVLLMALTLLPTEALAYVGELDKPLHMEAAPATVKREGIDDGSRVYSLKMNNGKLVFFLAVDGPHMGKSVTNSDRGYTATMASVRRGVYEQARFTLQTGRTQKDLTIEKMEVVDPAKEPQLSGVSIDMAPMENTLTVKYTLGGDALTQQLLCYISYYFVELSAGAVDGVLADVAEGADGRTYALVAQASWGLGMVTETTMPSSFVLRWYQDYHGFSRMGHAQADPAAHVKLSRTYKSGDTLTARSTDITGGLGRTGVSGSFGKGDVAEIYSDSYGVDSPFVLADVDRVRHTSDMWTPVYMTYDAEKDLLTAEGYTGTLGGRTGRSQMNALHIWGFRDVYTKAEAAAASEVRFTEPNRVTIPQDADRLGFYQTDGGILAAPITDTARETVLQKQYGAPLYILCGNFDTAADNTGKYYAFTDGKAALTSTITATWRGSGQHFYVRVDENGIVTGFDTTSGVEYSTPRFRLYSPVSAVTAPARLAFDETCLTLSMVPEDNAVLVFLDIPEVSSLIDTAQLKSGGDLVLSGRMGLDLILNCSPDALLTLEALGYGPKTNKDGSVSFEQNGVKANGQIDTAALIGLELAELQASINTFDGEEQYDFSLELNAFDLFETAAELQLKRLKNGRLAPNNLYFELAVEPGIPLVPPVPTAFLRGGGGGIYGLADTINGDYIAIPPVRLKLTAIGDYLKVIQGKLSVTVGPSYLEYGGRDITIAGADVLDSFNMHLKLVGEKRGYRGKTYTGLRAGGGMGVVIKAPQGDQAIFEVDGSAEASVFGGLDNYTRPTSAYLQLDSRGSISAKVMIPKRLGRVNFRRLGGKTLANSQVDFILGAQTAITVDPRSYAGKSVDEILQTAASSAWNNLSVYGGVSNKGNLLCIHYRIFYVIPDHVGGAVHLFRNINNGWSLEDEINKNAWFVSGRTAAQPMNGAMVQTTKLGDCYDPETGEQIGIAVMETSVYAVGEDSAAHMMTAPLNGRYSDIITYTADRTLPDGELGLLVFPKDDSLQALRSSIYVTADDTEVTLLDAGEDPDHLPAGANVTEIDVDGREGLLITTGSMADSNHVWKIEADCDFDCQLIAAALPTTLGLTLSADGQTAESTVQNPRDAVSYAVRYYFDTAQDRTGEHYFIGMQELSDGQRTDRCSVPVSGTLAPSGSYYVTAVLAEKVTDDFNGDGTVSADEYAWVTVDTQTSDTAVTFTNPNEPDAPADLTLDASGNETLTAAWTAAADVDGYRVTLYYLDNGSWQQAGAPYVLDNAAFDSGSTTPAASRSGGALRLRMAPTVGDSSDAAPANARYKVTVESYRGEDEASAPSSLRYYSKPAASGETYLPAYTAPAVTVTTGDGQTVTLDAANGYGSLTWRQLPTGALFTVTGSGVTDIAVTPEQAAGTFTVSGSGGTWTVFTDNAARQLIENSGRVKLTVRAGLDATDYYLRLSLDDVAPLLTLDAKNVRADMATGAYTVSGRTEPGLTVSMNTDGAPLTASADTQGRFTLTGILSTAFEEGFDANGDPIRTPNGFQSLVTEVTTQDGAGNAAAPAAVLISARPEIQAEDPEDPKDPKDPEGPEDPKDPENPKPSGGGHSVTPAIKAIRTNQRVRSATDYSGGAYGLTFRSTASFSSFKGILVDGWPVAPEHYTASEGSIVVYLKAAYLQTLTPGRHTLTILSSEGNASVDFTVGGVTAPATGDAGIALYAVAALLSLAGSAAVTGRRRRR